MPKRKRAEVKQEYDFTSPPEALMKRAAWKKYFLTKKLLVDNQVVPPYAHSDAESIKTLFSNNSNANYFGARNIFQNVFDLICIRNQNDNQYFVAISAMHKTPIKNPDGKMMGTLTTTFAQDIDTGYWYSVKHYIVDDKAPIHQRILNEQEALKRADQLMGSVSQANAEHPILTDIIIVKKYFPGENLLHLINQNTLTDSEKVDISIKAIQYLIGLHDKGILHCDINPENIIYDKKSKLLAIVDYDVSLLKASDSRIANAVEERGTAGFIAPELKQKNQKLNAYVYTEQSDTWALGMTLAELFGLTNYLSQKNSALASLGHRAENKPDQLARLPKLSVFQLEMLKIIKGMTLFYLDNRWDLEKALKEINKMLKKPECAHYLSDTSGSNPEQAKHQKI